MIKTIKQQLSELGMKEEELGNYCSDLHVLKNSISESFVSGYEFKQNVKPFRSELDGKIWYDIPFAYTEYYKNRG